MRVIPSNVHAILDYLMGALMILLPFLLGFAGGAETWILVIAGLGVIGYSLFTNYEYSLLRRIPLSTHLMMDVVAGIVLIILPWVLGFSETAAWTYVIIGLLEVGAGLMTRTVPHESHPPVHGVHAR